MPAKKTGDAIKTKKKLVIVESPEKAKTIKKYLGSSYNVMASVGHLRDLPKSQIGIDFENNYEPKYITIRGKGELIAKLKKDAKASSKVFLATDPDREGEAISWHLAQILGIDCETPCRITFNEITKNAVKEAVTHPRSIDIDLVDAQQARRIVDRIVGYKISPLLWKKVRKGLSAGRVQSVVTKLIVDREREIEAFCEEEFWTVETKLVDEKGKHPFVAKLQSGVEGKIELKTKEETDKVLKEIDNKDYSIKSVAKSDKTRNPAPPFTTSTMQQEASRKLGFTTRRTMSAAQQLYEGVDIKGHGSVGLITYMRTDSLRISTEAQNECRSFITEKFGKEYMPKTAKQYKTKKGAQDAHEAIRPTSVYLVPDEIKDSLKPDQYKLYKLVWNRFVASQMQSALLDNVRVDVACGDYIFRATGQTVKFDGFMKVYIEGKDVEEEKEGKLPPLAEGQKLLPKEVVPKQHFTQPPPRYTEASIIKAMEDEGIGRPSTYSPTITTITARGYVTRSGKTLVPTELGEVVTVLMEEHFKDIVNVKFTANMEEKLDEVGDGNKEWKNVIDDFYVPFEETLKKAEENIGAIEIKDEESDVPCEKCGRMMVIKQGRFGKFLACPGYPECKNTKTIAEPIEAPCPNCGKNVYLRKSKKGAKYYSCESGTDCFISWDEPTTMRCPQCGGILFKKRKFRGRGPLEYVCGNEKCGYKEEAKKQTK